MLKLREMKDNDFSKFARDFTIDIHSYMNSKISKLDMEGVEKLALSHVVIQLMTVAHLSAISKNSIFHASKEENFNDWINEIKELLNIKNVPIIKSDEEKVERKSFDDTSDEEFKITMNKTMHAIVNFIQNEINSKFQLKPHQFLNLTIEMGCGLLTNLILNYMLQNGDTQLKGRQMFLDKINERLSEMTLEANIIH